MVADLAHLRQTSNVSDVSSDHSFSSFSSTITSSTGAPQNNTDTLVAITKRFAEFEAAMSKISGSKQQPTDPAKHATTNQGGSTHPMNGAGAFNFFSSKFRSTEAAVMLIMLLPDAPASTQTNVLHAILQLVDANPCNARSLCDMQVPTFLLRVAPQLPESVLEKYFQLISRLLSYDVDPDVAVLMFRLSQCDPVWIDTAFNNQTEASRRLVQHLMHSNVRESGSKGNSNTFDLIQQRNDLQSLVLYILGTNMERKAPLSYFHFDGTGGALRTSHFERFPAARTGYSCSFWVKNNSFSCPEPTLFSWGFPHANKMLLQLFFMKPRLDLGATSTGMGSRMEASEASEPKEVGGSSSSAHQYRYLCVRSWPATEVRTNSGLKAQYIESYWKTCTHYW